MRNALVIARREIEEKKFVLWTALAFAVMPFLALALPAARVHDPRNVVALTAGLLTMAIVPALALILGGTMIGSDLSSGRLSFYFSKPLSARVVWYGKFAASLFFTFAAGALILGPAYLYSRRAWTGAWSVPTWVMFAVGIFAPIALLLIAHVVSTLFRARSAVLVFDATALVLAGGSLWMIAKPLIDAAAPALLTVMGSAIGVVMGIGAVLAGHWQLSRGRSDRHASHVELSKFLWSSIAVVLVLAAAVEAWIVFVKPSDVVEGEIYPASQGDWMIAGGAVPHRLDYHAAFLVNSSTGRYFRIPARDMDAGALVFSRDGKSIAWTHAVELRSGHGEVWTRRLDPIGPIRETRIPTTDHEQMAMSDDGSRIALIGGGVVNVADAATGHSLGSARAFVSHSRWDSGVYFVNPDVVRLQIVTSANESDRNKPRLNTVTISEFDVRTRKLVQTGTFDVMCRFLLLSATPDGERFIIRTWAPADPNDNLFMVDARTGARLSNLSTRPLLVRAALDDGTFVSMGARNEHWTLQRLSTDGRVLTEVDLGNAKWPHVAGGNAERVLLSAETDAHGLSALVVNLAQSKIERVIPNVRPAVQRLDYEDDPRIFTRKGPSFPCFDASGRIARIDINTGAVTPLPR